MSVCCTTLLSSEIVGPAYVQARSSNPRGRACRPNGKGSGEEGILSDVPVHLYCPAFSVEFIYAFNPGMHVDNPLSHSAYLTPSAQAELSGACGRAYRQPTNMQPGTFCYR